MSGWTFDSNIIIDALAGIELARKQIREAIQSDVGGWINRMVWIEVMSKGTEAELRSAETFLSAFEVDELDAKIATHAAALRRERPRLKSPDAVIFASAQVHDRVLVTRNTKDFLPGTPGIRVPYVL